MRGAEQSIGGGVQISIGTQQEKAPATDRTTTRGGSREGGGSHAACDSQNTGALAATQTIMSAERGQDQIDNQSARALLCGQTILSAEGDRSQYDNHSELVSLCGQIRELLQRRRDLHGPEKSLTLRILGLCRRLCDGDKGEAKKLYKAISGKKIGDHPQAMAAHVLTLPFFTARAVFVSQRAAVEKEMKSRAKELPIYDWWCSHRGLAPLGLALLVGEACGAELTTIGDYDTVSKLWKRMGLAVIGDGRQRRVRGEAALDHGYSPERRAVIWTIGSSVFRAQSASEKTGRGAGPYRIVYDEYKERKTAEGWGKSPKHRHSAATRYMEKRLLRDVWRQWRAAVTNPSTMM